MGNKVEFVYHIEFWVQWIEIPAWQVKVIVVTNQIMPSTCGKTEKKKTHRQVITLLEGLSTLLD